jgi:hypothetical protein
MNALIGTICLVVHSYGGWPASGALEQIGDRVTSIVWLDAFKPEDGQRGVDFASEFARRHRQGIFRVKPHSAYHARLSQRASTAFETVYFLRGPISIFSLP